MPTASLELESGAAARARGASLGRSGQVLAVLIALLAGLFGAAVAARTGWEFARPIPAGGQAEELIRTAAPGVSVSGGGNAPLWTHSRDDEYIEYGSAHYTVKPPVTGGGDFAVGMRERLVAAGWQVRDDGPDLGMSPDRLQARRGDLMLIYDGGVDFAVARSAPGWLWIFAVVGALVGALIGWLVTGWASRRAGKGSAAARLAGLVVWPTAGVMVVLLFGALLLRPALQSWRDRFYLHLLYLAGGPPKWVGVVAVVALGVVLVLGQRRPRPVPPL